MLSAERWALLNRAQGFVAVSLNGYCGKSPLEASGGRVLRFEILLGRTVVEFWWKESNRRRGVGGDVS